MSFCLHYSCFIIFPRISIPCILNQNFEAKMTLDYKNDHPFPSLRSFHVFFLNFIKFGCDRILRHLGSVSIFAVHKVERFKKSPKFTWRTGDETKVKIFYLFGYLKVVLHALFDFHGHIKCFI